jgi:hypothetical protein
MTSESTGSEPETFDADNHDQETKKSYYHVLDDESVGAMKKYFKVEDDHDSLLRYLKNREVPKTTPDHV